MQKAPALLQGDGDDGEPPEQGPPIPTHGLIENWRITTDDGQDIRSGKALMDMESMGTW